MKQSEKALDKQVFAHPDTVFSDIEDLLSVVASGKWRTLLVTGMGGVGKCLGGDTEVNIKWS